MEKSTMLQWRPHTQEYFSNPAFTYFDDCSCQFERTKEHLTGYKAHPVWSAGGNILSGLGHEDSAWWVVNNLMETKSGSIGRIWCIRCQGNSKLTVSSLICGPYTSPCFSVLHRSCLDLNNPVIPHFPHHNEVKPMRLLPKTYLFPFTFFFGGLYAHRHTRFNTQRKTKISLTWPSICLVINYWSQYKKLYSDWLSTLFLLCFTK